MEDLNIIPIAIIFCTILIIVAMYFIINQGQEVKLTGIQGYSHEYNFSIRFRKYYCPMCDELLKIKKVSKVVNSESEEAKDYDFRISAGEGDRRIRGNVEFSREVLHCQKCDVEVSAEDAKKYKRERQNRCGD